MKSSTSGTPSQAMTSSDIRDIIKECGRSGVHTLSYNGLTISFNSDRPLELPKAQNTVEAPQKIELTAEQKEEMREWDRLQLAIDDPVAYENEQMEEDVERARQNEGIKDRGFEPTISGSGGR